MSSVAREISDINKRLGKMDRQLSKLPTRIESSAGGGAGSAASAVFIEVPSEAELPDPTDLSRKVFGIVNSGVDEGMLYIINPAKNGWDCLTKFG